VFFIVRSYSILLDYEKARHNFGNVGVDGSGIVTSTEKQGVRLWTGFIWLL
jgi:hypothetical protein